MLGNIHKQYTFSINIGDGDVLRCTKFFDSLQAVFTNIQSFIVSKAFLEEWHEKMINEITVTVKTLIVN